MFTSLTLDSLFRVKKSRKLITTVVPSRHVYFRSFLQGFFQIACSCITYSTREKSDRLDVVVIPAHLENFFHSVSVFCFFSATENKKKNRSEIQSLHFSSGSSYNKFLRRAGAESAGNSSATPPHYLLLPPASLRPLGTEKLFR